jgi:hypothetical protein
VSFSKFHSSFYQSPRMATETPSPPWKRILKLEPKELVDALEQGAELPSGDEERFAGYGVMGLPFSSGHILCLRRWPASSLGRGYTSVWHRNPEGRWTFIQDAPPQQACSRYFGSAVTETLMREIEIVWSGPRDLTVRIDGDYTLNWQVSLAQTLGTRLMNAAGGLVPNALWRNVTVLKLIGAAGSRILGAGCLSLTGHVPNGQRYVANPRHLWPVTSSVATVYGQDIGPIGPLPVQARLGDVWIPQRGRFFIGNAFLEVFDPTRHLSATSKEG